MRRLVLPVVAACGLLAIGAGPASAAPGPAGETKAAAGKKVCTISSELLDELSGLVATDDGYIAINDGTDSVAKRKVFFLDKKCGIDDAVSFPDRPRDPEDLALSPDGSTLWIADVGDNVTNSERRSTVALWTMPADGSKRPVIHRLRYPEGDGPHDAEALLLTQDNVPIVVTKEIGRSGLYMPQGKLKPNNSEGVALKRVGEFTVPASTTPTGFIPGRVTVTGGAVAPGGGKVVLRTYSDAYEWDVTNGDILAALKNPPRVTPLPDEPFGEAIAYTPDGKEFLTVSDLGAIEDKQNEMLSYTPVSQVVTASAGQPGAKGEAGADDRSWMDSLSLSDVTYLVAGVGAIGAILVGMGVFGIVRGRRRAAEEPDGEGATVPGKGAAVAGKGTVQPKRPAATMDAETAQMGAVSDDRPLEAAGRGKRGGVYRASPVTAPPPAHPKTSPQKGAVYGGAPAPAPAPGPAAPPAPAPVPASSPPGPAGPARDRKGGVYGGTSGQGGGGGGYGDPPPTGGQAGYGGGRQATAHPDAAFPGRGTHGDARGVRRESHGADEPYAGHHPYEPRYRG
jgi:hypothetical protein